MGYESKIYVVKKYEAFAWENKKYASVIAKMDMSKCYPLSGMLRDKPDTDCYFYADDGDTRVEEDCYGMPLTECSIPEAIELVEKVMQNDEYWRFDILLGMLKAFEPFASDDLVVLHYGY